MGIFCYIQYQVLVALGQSKGLGVWFLPFYFFGLVTACVCWNTSRKKLGQYLLDQLFTYRFSGPILKLGKRISRAVFSSV